MSASSDTSFHRMSSPSAAGRLSRWLSGWVAALSPRVQLAGRRQRVGAITVWDGQAGFRLPAGRSRFRLGLYVTFRRDPGDDDPDGQPPVAAVNRAAAAADFSAD